MKVLVAISSCGRDTKNGFNQAVRDTWLKDLRGADYKFFLGRDVASAREDEIVVDAPDDYRSLPWKTKALLQWALDCGYDYVWKADTDTYVVPDRLLHSGFANHDYIGHFNAELGNPNIVYGKCFTWASGGSGYWLSRRAAEHVVKHDPIPLSLCPVLNIPCEDLWVGQVLGPKIADGTFKAKHDPRYASGFDEIDFRTEISSHFCSEGAGRSFDVEWMYKHYQVNA